MRRCEKATSARSVMQAGRKVGLAGAKFTLIDLSDRLELQTYEDRARLRECVRYLVKRGRLLRFSRGVFHLPPGDPGQDPPQKQQVMWRLLRLQRTVTVEDLQEISGASGEYAKEWLRHLVERGIIRDHLNGNFQLIVDLVEMPFNYRKSARLRALRESKASAIRSLQAAKAAIDEAVTAVGGMALEDWAAPEGEGDES